MLSKSGASSTKFLKQKTNHQSRKYSRESSMPIILGSYVSTESNKLNDEKEYGDIKPPTMTNSLTRTLKQ